MTPKEKQENFHKELIDLLGRYKAEIIIEDFARGYSSDPKIVVNFYWDEDLIEENNTGRVDDLILGTYISGN